VDRGGGYRPLRVANLDEATHTVLIVEDDDAVRNALREALVAERYQAISVGNLPSARRALAEVRFDVVLLDLLLAGEDGVDLLDEMSRTATSPPVLIVSALLTADEARRKFGVSLLPKPFDIDQLLAAIEKAIRTESRPRRR
jgi:DNA-binding NtrC family response regulator